MLFFAVFYIFDKKNNFSRKSTKYTVFKISNSIFYNTLANFMVAYIPLFLGIFTVNVNIYCRKWDFFVKTEMFS